MKFSAGEDEAIVFRVSELGQQSWTIIAQRLGARVLPQCRERRKHYFSPGISREPWTPTEGAILTTQHGLVGPKSSTIWPLLPGRADVSIKNRWAVMSPSHQRPKPDRRREAEKRHRMAGPDRVQGLDIRVDRPLDNDIKRESHHQQSRPPHNLRRRMPMPNRCRRSPGTGAANESL
jgi:hypothetical protein